MNKVFVAAAAMQYYFLERWEIHSLKAALYETR